MKTISTLISFLLLSTIGFTQNGINYKALIKDPNGNVVASTSVDILFTIYEGQALTNNVYQENHSINTDANGFVIVNIGKGTTSDDFTTINWRNDEHYLNVQADIGPGLVDMGTTQFMAVPYALSSADNPWSKDQNGIHVINTDVGIGVNTPEAQLDIRGGDWNLDAGNPGDLRIGNTAHNFRIGVATGGGGAGITRLFTNSNALFLGTNDTPNLILETNGSILAPAINNSLIDGSGNKALITKEYLDANNDGLESLNEGNGLGFRLTDKNPSYYGNIGLDGVDLSISTSGSSFLGATGNYSFATGFRTRAEGDYSTAIGNSTNAMGDRSIAIGTSTWTHGDNSISIGRGSSSRSYAEITMGTFNTYYAPNSTTTFEPNDRLFVIGNGTSVNNTSNAFTVLKNGDIGIGTDNPEELLHIEGVLRIGTETIEDTGLNKLSFDASLLPNVNNSTDLGASDFRWKTIYATNGSINTSDRREKKNIKDLNYGLAEVLQMQPVSFNWKDKNNPDIKLGLIAQDVLELIPEVVKTHEWKTISEDKTELQKVKLDRLGVYYSDLIPVLIRAIQEQQDIIETLKAKDKTQQYKLNNIEQNYQVLLSRIEQLESKSSN